MSESGATLRDGLRAKWAALGRPLLNIYGPVGGWTLPGGVSYDEGQDRFEDGDGDEVAVDYSTAAMITTARYVPVQPANSADRVDVGDDLAFDEPGLLVRVEYSAAVETALADTWGIGVGGTVYRQTTKRRRYLPLGATTPVVFEMELFNIWGDTSETIAIRRNATTLTNQRVRITRMGTQAQRQDSGAIEQSEQRVAVIGMPGIDIAKGDRFNDAAGLLYEIDFVRPDRSVMTVAEARVIE